MFHKTETKNYSEIRFRNPKSHKKYHLKTKEFSLVLPCFIFPLDFYFVLN